MGDLLKTLNGVIWYDYIIGIILIKIGWGFIFELTNGILGTISDYTKDKNENNGK